MQKIVPNIWCNRTAEEAAAFYVDAFPGASSKVTGRYPADGLPDWQQAFAGMPVTVDVEIEGFRVTLINADDNFRPGPALSFVVNADPLRFDGDVDRTRAWIDECWSRLIDGGTVRMPLDAYPFSPRYGWVEDRYGVSWQFMLTDPAGEPRPAIMPALLFSGRAQNRAREAIEWYAEIIADSSVGMVAPYPGDTGPARANDVMFAEFRLADVWLAAMDSGSPDAWDFSPGVSLEIRCADQAEIDELWDTMSAVPEAEQCGWLVDRFGVSWQIVPANMGDLMHRPGAYTRMLDMKKIVIADL